MRSLFKGTILTLLLTQICFAQWFWQNPLPQGNSLYSIFFINSDTGWAVGEAGTILRTTNHGITWISQQSGVQSELYSVYFLNTLLNTFCISCHDSLSAFSLYARGMLNLRPTLSAMGFVKLCLAPS